VIRTGTPDVCEDLPRRQPAESNPVLPLLTSHSRLEKPENDQSVIKIIVGVNFINILCANFSYKSAFSLVTKPKRN